MNQLIRLVYASRSVAAPSAPHLGLDPGVARILAKSRKNNARLGVVGGLLFGEGFFLQCLEGDAGVVQTLYSKIETDQRHRDVTVLLQSTINQRTFGTWSMKYVPGEQRLQSLMRLWGVRQFDPYQLTKDQIDEAVRFMRDEDDAVDTIPSELTPLAEETEPVVRPVSRSAAPRNASRTSSDSGSGAFVKVVVGVGLVLAAVLAFLLLR